MQVASASVSLVGLATSFFKCWLVAVWLIKEGAVRWSFPPKRFGFIR